MKFISLIITLGIVTGKNQENQGDGSAGCPINKKAGISSNFR